MLAPRDFSSLGLPASLLEALASLGFERMTEIQALALPDVLAGRDVLGQAEPGSGKTLAFGIGALVRVLPHLPPAPARVRSLVLCPTRELAEQVATEIRRAARRTPNVKVLTACGGVPFRAQRESLKQGAHVVVGTPGRIQEHLRKASLPLDALEVLVLDEADRMLSMGFLPQLEAIVEHAPRERQTLLFSATYPESIAELGRRFQRDPRHIGVAPATGTLDASDAASDDGPAPASAAPAARVESRFHRVDVHERTDALARWLSLERPASTLVFSNTRSECASVAEALSARGWVAASIHGELSQRERTHVTRLFANESCPVLVATDVAARGWDIGGLAAVVSLGLPRDPSVHHHRVGRTGRAGQTGLAVHFVASEDLGALAAIERDTAQPAVFSELPSPSEPLPPPSPPRRVTLVLAAGKSKKLRPGDILGALTAEGGISGDDVGLIHIDENEAYVAIRREAADRALAILERAPVKGRRIRAKKAGLSVSS
ncbi:MAG TPA: DEAD/DEAH box helicase [Polyangiaceae bacterium]|nr:DEAD/DEAH box helicase [Polyangiaceae bacterium]